MRTVDLSARSGSELADRRVLVRALISAALNPAQRQGCAVPKELAPAEITND